MTTKGAIMRRISLDASLISDWPSFQDVFADLFNFPDYYGRNMNAWIDCMSDDNICAEAVLLEIRGTVDFKKRLPEIFDALIDCTAFVNKRYSDEKEIHLYLGFVE